MRVNHRRMSRKIFWTVLATLTVQFSSGQSDAYPIFAQQNYENPREANGRIVCANCHLAQKPAELDVPQAVLPASVFEATVKIPYDTSLSQVQAGGKRGDLNVGMVLILPEGFTLAPADRVPPEMRRRVGNVSYQPYSENQKNIIVAGPLPGKTNSEMIVPLLSPDPAETKNVHYLKYPIYLGANRGRGQLYPDGSKSNNNIFNASVSGTITRIESSKKYVTLTVTGDGGSEMTEKIPSGPQLIVSEGQKISVDQPLTGNPNVGGFGQAEGEIVLQNPGRIVGLVGFLVTVFLTQVFFVLKKKQIEKVQLAEMNF